MDHSGCDAFQCLADNVDEDTYKTIHVEAGCQCPSVSVSGDALRAVPAKGKVPRISISDDLKLTIVQNRPYVAISHVWSHGLGNSFENALPTCQLRRLRGYLADLNDNHPHLGLKTKGSHALWIDTLCIPVAPHLKQYRKKAITLLGQTYSDAVVLVLDRELMDLDPRSTAPLERSLRVLCCGWMRRPWTLQEATLARNLFLKLREGVVLFTRPEMPADPREHWHVPGEKEKATLFNTLETTLGSRIPTASRLRSPPSKWNYTGSAYKSLWFAVRHQATTKAKDEPVILATIMRLPTSEILEAQEMVAQFYVLMRKVPSDIIFYDLVGKNLKHAPFRWAPATLVGSGIQTFDMDTEHPPAICDNDGLHVVYSGFVFSEGAVDRLHLRMQFHIRDRRMGDLYRVKVDAGGQLAGLLQRPAMIFRGPKEDAVIVNILGERRRPALPL